MKRTTALIAFSSAMALATAASAQLVGGGLTGGAAGQLGGGVGSVTGGLTGQAAGGAQATGQGSTALPSRIRPPAATATPSVTTGASTDASAKAADRQASGGVGVSTTAQPSVSTSAVNPPVAGANSQGAANASATGVANANANAAIASTTAPDLTSLRAGQTVRDAAGATLGTVSKVERAADGTVKNVLVAGADGKKKVMRLAPNSLSLSGDVVTTTSTKADAKSGTNEER